MATDAYVMPLWRFKAGDFSSSLSALGGRTLVITARGVKEEKPRRPGFVKRWRCRREARNLMRDVAAQSGSKVAWTDEGEVVYSNQFRGGPAIRSFLWWVDRRDVLPDYRLFVGRKDEWLVSDPVPQRPPARPHLSMNGYYSD